MNLSQDASDSNKTPADCLPESQQAPLLEQMLKIDDHQSIDVTTQETEQLVEDKKTKPKTRRIHPSCDGDDDIGMFYHLDTADVKFIFDVDGNEEMVPAHKCMLAFHSPVFRQMFYGELKEKGDIKLNDTTVDAFVDLMKCMYAFELTIEGTQSKITPLLELAHKYDVNWVEKECQRILDEIISKNIVEILWVVPLANLYIYKDLSRKCIKKILKHGKSIIESAEFVDCEMKMMVEILGINFVGRDEAKVFEICIKWAKRSCEKAELDLESPENIRAQLGDCFDFIRFESMTQEQFLQCLSISPAVFTSHEIAQIASKLSRPIAQNEHRESNNNVALKPFKIVSPFNTAESSLQLLLEDHTTADVTFVFKNDANEDTELIPANKCILASQSKVFTEQFKDSSNLNDEIAIAGVSSEVFMYFLRLMYVQYGNQFLAILKEVGEQHFDALLSLNKKYIGNYLMWWYTKFENHLIDSLNEQNVIQRFKLAQKHSMDKLKTKSVDVLKEKSEQIITSGTFMDCGQENLKAVLELRIWDKEKSLIDVCIKWAKKYCTENQLNPAVSYDLRTAFGDAFEFIPFSKMDPLEFINFQHNHYGLLTADEVLKVINDFGLTISSN